jgi:hypothetical protein
MKTYTCVCGGLLFFQNVVCVHCGRALGFLPEPLLMTSLEPEGKDLWRPTKGPTDKLYRKCQNYWEKGVCNWMVPEEAKDEAFCISCRLDEIIPDLSKEENRILWTQIEGAKRRLVYSLIRLKLPIASKKDDPDAGVAFRFLSDELTPDGKTASHVMTGHDHGIITLNIAEADDATREALRHAMNEPYRTLLGHFRHEIGHYYWDRLIRDTEYLAPFRELFGDEQADYDQALKKYYEAGALPDWQTGFISAYATAHPWEDWAETWAHFLHIQDALEVANDFGLAGKRVLLEEECGDGTHPSKQSTFDEVILSWSQLTVALNSINRSMGHADLYPFILSPAVIGKLRFIYEVIVSRKAAAPVLEPNSVPVSDEGRREEPATRNMLAPEASEPSDAPAPEKPATVPT